MTIRFLPVVLALAIASCASAPPAPSAPDSAGIAIGVSVRPPVRLFSQEPEQVLFVRLAGADDSFTSGELMPSNYSSGGYLYLLNAPPGTYVAVSCFKDMEPVPAAPAAPGFSVTFGPGATNYTTYFPENMIRETRVTVGPGQIAFMGNFTVDQDVGLKDADPTQHAYYARFGGGDENENFLMNALGGDYHYRGTLHESDHAAAAQADFRESANSHLSEAGWKPQSEH
ncbi:MAG: hypothetical protein EXS08_02000 [Planctomycetes bacterium]|nr:hypothetical protein [Planctomycetota bacterium]